MRHKTPKTSSIEKALSVLMAFTSTSHNHEMGTVELSQKLGFHPATVSRILQILSQKGFLQHNGRTRKFTLGPSTFELGKPFYIQWTSVSLWDSWIFTLHLNWKGGGNYGGSKRKIDQVCFHRRTGTAMESNS
jgi:hypothetical protein